MNPALYAKVTLSIFLLLCPVFLFAADTKSAPVAPVGTYSRTKATEDHTYGHEMRLWQSGGRLIGQVLYWDGNPEAQRGMFTEGTYHPRSGEIQFKVMIMRRDVQPNVQTTATFNGRVVQNTVTGSLQWEGQAVESRGKSGIERLSLHKSQDSPLDKYANVDSWRKAMAD